MTRASVGVGVLVALMGVMPSLNAQSLSVADRITWEEALLAQEEGSDQEAMMLLDDVIDAAGPVPGVLYDAAWMSFNAREYERADGYIRAVLETNDADYRKSEEYDDAFRLAAQIQRALRPVRDSQVQATPLPFSDSLARIGFSREMKDRSGCEWKFDRGGLVGKYRDRGMCMNGEAATTGRVRIEFTVEQRGGGGRSSAGLVFGLADAENYNFLRLHPRWSELGGDMSLLAIREGQESVVLAALVPDERGRPLRSWNEEGPWRVAVEIRGRKVDWFLNGQHAGTAVLDSEVRGGVMAAVAGADGGEFLFTNLSIDRLQGSTAAAR